PRSLGAGEGRGRVHALRRRRHRSGAQGRGGRTGPRRGARTAGPAARGAGGKTRADRGRARARLRGARARHRRREPRSVGALRTDPARQSAARVVRAAWRRLRPLLHGSADAAPGPDPAWRVDRRLRGLRRAAVRSGMIPARWAVAAPPDPQLTAALASDLHIPEPLAALLVQRGLAAPELAKAFLRPDLERLSDPHAWADMPRAVEPVVAAVRAGAPILVHGGYDFGPAGLAEARRLGAGLIITCDCGITAVEVVRAARAAGIEVIVTDHHLPGDELPPASAVLDPQRADCRSAAKELCGTGVAFKLAQALVPALGLSPHLPLHFLDLVALATVADVVPLTGENRILVRHGLKLLAESHWTGVRALIETAGLAGRPIKSGHVGFILAPRLNAAGRIGDANDGLRLLLSDDPQEAAAIARELETL